MAHIVAVEYEGSAADLIQLLLDGMGKGGFPRPGKPGKPKHRTAVAIQLLATQAIDRGMVPDDIA